jgi:transposase
MSREVLPEIEEAEVLDQLLRSEARLKRKHAVRVQAVLGRASGRGTVELAEALRAHPVSISQWVRLFNEQGIEALACGATRQPGKAPITDEVEREVLRIVGHEEPEGATHRSTRAVAKRVGISHTKVSQILKEHGLKPHLVKTFPNGNDPEFEQKLEDVVGLYLAPPANSIVFCLDEKSRIQALERAQPILPLRPGIPERRSHDYIRHGTTTLFAALNVASGKVIGESQARHTGSDFLAFLKLVDKNSPKAMVLHLIVDNVSSHKAKEVKAYLESKSERFVVHYTPTHPSSWLNLIERWFAEVATKQVRRASWTSVKEMERALLDHIKHWNKRGKKFVWTKNSAEIMDAIAKATKD